MNNDEGLSVDVSNNRGFVNNDYPVDVISEVHPYLRSEDSVSSVPPPMVNGGLYGPQNDALDAKIRPTNNYIFYRGLVKHADPAPPPGIAEQYPGRKSLRNNYTTMPGVNGITQLTHEIMVHSALKLLMINNHKLPKKQLIVYMSLRRQIMLLIITFLIALT